jgi:RNA polymerase sigma-70 factor (ECF subfamily)
MNTTSVSLLESLRQRPDGPSWQRFADLYHPLLRGQLRRHGLQAADVDDLVQEVMTVLMKEVPHFQHNGRKGAFRTWLRGITVNRLRELWRQEKYVPAAGGSDFAEKLAQLADDQSQLSRLWDREHDQHVVNQLLKAIAVDFEPRTRLAFRAVVMDGRKAADVAVELGISEGAVWTAKSHVLKRLRQVADGLLD